MPNGAVRSENYSRLYPGGLVYFLWVLLPRRARVVFLNNLRILGNCAEYRKLAADGAGTQTAVINIPAKDRLIASRAVF